MQGHGLLVSHLLNISQDPPAATKIHYAWRQQTTNYCLLKGPPCARGTASQPAALSPVSDVVALHWKSTAVRLPRRKRRWVPVLGVSSQGQDGKKRSFLELSAPVVQLKFKHKATPQEDRCSCCLRSTRYLPIRSSLIVFTSNTIRSLLLSLGDRLSLLHCAARCCTCLSHVFLTTQKPFIMANGNTKQDSTAQYSQDVYRQNWRQAQVGCIVKIPYPLNVPFDMPFQF